MRQLEPASSPALPTQMAIAKVAVRTSEIVHGGDGDAGAGRRGREQPDQAEDVGPRAAEDGGNGAAAVEEQREPAPEAPL